MSRAGRRTFEPGDVLDAKYEIRRVLGEGGMGVVYEAFHKKLEQPVAIKVMLPEMLDHPTLVARFEREARASAKLKSKHVARVYDVDVTTEGLPFLVMELLTGRDLSQLLAEKHQLPVADAVDYVVQACSAIREAHARGIVHRDLKPANLFLAQEGNGVVVKVLDFGISKELATSAKLTHDHGVVGTVLYMSPEQLRGGVVDGRSDIWALGALLYELIAGHPPFDGTVTQASIAIASESAPPLERWRTDVPRELEAVIFRALEKAPDARPRDVTTFVDALAPFASAGVVERLEAEPPPTPSSPGVAAIDPTAPTLSASDRLGAPRATATADGLFTEPQANAAPPRRLRSLLFAGVAIAAIAGVGAVVTRTRTRTRTEPPAPVVAPPSPSSEGASASASASASATALAAIAPSDSMPSSAPPASSASAAPRPSVPHKPPARPKPNAPAPAPSPPRTPAKPTPPDHL